MVEAFTIVLLVAALPIVAWRAWLWLFPGISLHSDYGIRGGWFGTIVTVKGFASSGRRDYSS